MAWMEEKYFSKTEFDKIIEELSTFIKAEYEPADTIERNGSKHDVFYDGKGLFFYPGYMYTKPQGETADVRFFVIEYGESIEELQDDLGDEGGQFFPEDYESKEAMFEAMLKEIEG